MSDRLHTWVLTTIATGVAYGIIAGVTGSYYLGIFGAVIGFVWFWLGLIWGYGEAVGL